MPKVYTTTPGAETVISHYGPATNDRPAVVPQAVADELRALPDGGEGPEFRIEQDEAQESVATLSMGKGKHRAAPAAAEADASKPEKE